jgi:hypothetical protein
LRTAAIAAAVVALSAVAAAAAVGQEEPVPTRDCRSRGDPSTGRPVRFASARDVVVGPISFAGLARAATRPGLGVPRPDGTWFVKSGAKILWGRPVLLAVGERARASLSLGYAPRGEPSVAVRFEPCRPGTRMYRSGGRLRRVTAFPGGFVVARPGCYELEVRVERGRSFRRTVSFGAGSC